MLFMQKITIRQRLSMFMGVILPILFIVARHTQVTIWFLRFLTVFTGQTDKRGTIPISLKLNFDLKFDTIKVCLWVTPIGKSDQSRWFLRISAEPEPMFYSHKNVAFA